MVFAPLDRFLDDVEIVHDDLGLQFLAAADHAVDAIRIDRIVGIEHRDPAALRNVEPGIAGAARATILSQLDDAHDVRGEAARDIRPCRRSSNRRRR